MRVARSVAVAWVLSLGMGALACDGPTSHIDGAINDDSAPPRETTAEQQPDGGKADEPQRRQLALSKRPADPSLQPYPSIPKPIAASCSTPSVIVVIAPESVGASYTWTWTRQAMLANQQFEVVPGEPRHPGQVTFELHQASSRHNNVWVLVAKCQDSRTCNDLAAMLAATIEGTLAQPVCRRLPMELGPATTKGPVLQKAGLSTHALPGRNNALGACARFQACRVAMDPVGRAGKESIGFDCRKAPASFELDCARRYPCQEVMKCLAK